MVSRGLSSAFPAAFFLDEKSFAMFEFKGCEEFA